MHSTSISISFFTGLATLTDEPGAAPRLTNLWRLDEIDIQIEIGETAIGGKGGSEGGSESGGEGEADGEGEAGEGEGRAHLTLRVTPVRPSAVWRWISAQEIRLSVSARVRARAG